MLEIWPAWPSSFGRFQMKDHILAIVSLTVTALAVGYAAWLHSRVQSTQTVFGLLLVAAGGFGICGAGCNWDWFMEHRNGRLLVAICGRTGARVVHGFIGILLVLFGLWFQVAL